MFSKIVILALVAAVAYGQADRYPAGVNPQLCPNYPNCDNSLLATYNNAGAPAPYVAPAPYIPQYNPAAYAPAPAAAARYPAGVDPSTCPNYPYCGSAPSAPVVAPLPGFAARQYPAGVNPAVCPSYPYCN